MFAVLKTGGKQYRVAPGDVFVAEKISELCALSIKDGVKKRSVAQATHVFKDVLCLGAEGKTHIGEPLLKDAEVLVDVLDYARAKKVLIFKKKRRNNYRRLNGHRQEGVVLRVKDVRFQGKSLVGDVVVKATSSKASVEKIATQKTVTAKTAERPVSEKKAAAPKKTPETKTSVQKPKVAAKAKAPQKTVSTKKE